MATEFKYLFSPIKIGPKTAKNRVVSPAHFTFYGSGLTGYSPYQLRSELTDDRYAIFLEEKAKGGCGVIVTRTCGVGPKGDGWGEYVPPTPERLREACKRISEACQKHGALAILQMGNFGYANGDFSGIFPGKSSIGLSPVPEWSGGEMPHVMEIEEIEELIDQYVATARGAREGGMDGVELHVSEGMLFQQSLSSTFNRRTDKYGPGLGFLTEVINRVRAEIGGDIILALKMISDEMFPKEAGGLDSEALAGYAAELDRLGKVDLITTAHNKSLTDLHHNIQPMYIPEGAFLPIDAQIKQAVKNIVVCAGGRIKDPVQAENALADGMADMVGMVRAQIADPHWVRKAQAGKTEDIRICIGCLQGCNDRIAIAKPITCTQNPACGREWEFGGTVEPCLDRAQAKKKVVVIGGGPGGLEAARVSAERGHEVTLYEKRAELGGQINILTRLSVRGEFADVIRYRETQLKKLGVKVNLGAEATAEQIIAENPDVVIIATGSQPFPPEIAGIDQDNVLSVQDVLLGTRPVGERVVICDKEWRQKAVTAAEILLDQGKQVEIVTSHPDPALFAGWTNQTMIKQRLYAKGVKITPNTEVVQISGKTLHVIQVYSYQPSTIEGVDTFVYATYNKAEDGLYKELKGKVKRLELVGDAWAPRTSLHAIHDAFFLAREI